MALSLKFLKDLFKTKGVKLSSISSPKDDTPSRRKGSKTLARRSSQCYFSEPNQTAIVLDFDDTLFPTTFVERECGSKHGMKHHHPHQPLAEEDEDQLKSMLGQIEECQSSAESLLKCAKNHGGIFVVTLSGRNNLKKVCEKWYPRVWNLLKSQVTMVYALEMHHTMLHLDHSELDESEYSAGYRMADARFSAGYWAWVKGRAIAKEMDRFYSQYNGQTWKNIISIGDSNFERYGTLGAATAYVQKRFGNADTKESSAYIQGWQRFDSDPQWSQGFEGLHEGHVFKVRTKVMKLIDEPSPADLAQQLKLLLKWFPMVVTLDGCLNLFLDDLSEDTVQSHELAIASSATDGVLFPRRHSGGGILDHPV